MKDYCPNCGLLSDILEEYGWCKPCVKQYQPILLICSGCGREFPADGQFRVLCRTCRYKEWQARNADAIEMKLAAGLSIKQAIAAVKAENRPICLSCGGLIKGGRAGKSLFCRKTVRCRKAARQYKWLRERYHASQDEAIEKVLTALATPAQEAA